MILIYRAELYLARIGTDKGITLSTDWIRSVVGVTIEVRGHGNRRARL